ncbi:MAG TPA: DUF3105 domain-containing protein [Candidatus Manganitrophaceae bacterium]|nr:DUF3105 domain-containing protein [Candidatus Manganitrophaceae bacterium]
MKRLSIGIIVALSLLIFNPAVHAVPPPSKKTAKAPQKEPGVSVPSLGNDHVSSLETPHIPYNSKPPTSGPHLPMLAKWGIYDRPIPNELQVHNLEDGGVLIQYDCKNCAELIQKLERLVKGYYERAKVEKEKTGSSKYEHLIVAPYPGLETPVALTAWGKIDKLTDYDEARIKRFIEAYVGIDHHPKRPN